MSHSHPRGSSIVIHKGRAYDLAFGWLLRRNDAELLARAGVAHGDHLLDVGTGPGYIALAASRLVGPEGAAVGIDASPEMIDRARVLAARGASNAEYRVASAEALPFDDGTFDVVVSRLVLHHLTGDVRARALGEMARVLKPGGRLLIADMASPGAKGAHHLVAHLLGNRPDTSAGLEDLVAGAGFTQVAPARLMHGMLSAVTARRPESTT